jgi:tetratricopeptide (TPR) repeat protein
MTAAGVAGVTTAGLTGVRAAVIGLIGFAAAEEQILLVTAPSATDGGGGEPGPAGRWAAAPLVAHNTEFKRQQVRRLEAIRAGQAVPTFAAIDHASPEVYRRYRAQPADEVAAASGQTSQDLIAALNLTAAADLSGGTGQPQVAGRQLWLQVVVRGFWHPCGHLGDYYLAHGQAGRAVALAAQAVAWASYLGAPEPARGMACYNLACAQAQAGRPDEAARTAEEAITLNPALVANVSSDPDLAALRDSGRLDQLLAHN